MGNKDFRWFWIETADLCCSANCGLNKLFSCYKCNQETKTNLKNLRKVWWSDTVSLKRKTFFVCSCKYSISVPANSQLLISISKMDVECPYDYVQFAFNNNAPTSTLCPLSSVSGMYTIDPQATSFIFNVLFNSDSTIRFSGFSMNIYLNVTGSPTTLPPVTTTKATTTKATTTKATTTKATTTKATTTKATTTAAVTTTTKATTTVVPGLNHLKCFYSVSLKVIVTVVLNLFYLCSSHRIH